MQSIWVFCDASHTNWGMVFTVRHRKRMVTGVTDWGSEFAMWWSGTASINLSVILSRRWSLNTGCHSGQPLFTRPRLCLWETLIRPPLLSFRSPFAPTPAFISTLQAVPFQSIISSTPNSGSQRRGERGKHAKRCGIFFIVLGIHSKPSQGTLPFPSRFPPPHLSPLNLPSSTSLYEKPL